jgi:prepilin-type N-terminal cleavage/methylation domain-containing protein
LLGSRIDKSLTKHLAGTARPADAGHSNIPPAAMKRQTRQHRKAAGFTLVEVMITMFLISMMCLGVFAGLQQITKAMASVAIRDEAYHLMQAEAERLLNTDFASFSASGPQTIHCSFGTSFARGNNTGALTGSSSVGRVDFVRQVLDVGSTQNPATQTLRIQITWAFPDQRPNVISTTLFRTRS